MENTIRIEKYSPEVLGAFIECFSIYHFSKGQDVQLFPKGIFEMVFQSNDCFEHQTAYSTGWEARPKDFIGGLHNKSYLVKPRGGDNYCIVVEFKPHTAKYFLPYSLHEFKNQIVDIIDLWGNPARELISKIYQEKINIKKIKLIEDFLYQKLLNPEPSVIDLTIPCIQFFKGFIEIKQLANSSHLSAAQFRKRFKEEIGIAPSQYCKIVRINSVLEILSNQPSKSLTELTYDLGYFDQSHFIKDFKSVIGTSPKQFKKAI